MEYRSKHNDKHNSIDLAIRINDSTDLLEKSVFENIKLTIIQHDIINILLELFIHMAAYGDHIDSIRKDFNAETGEYQVEFYFGKFNEDVIISWGKNVSLIEIKAYTFVHRLSEGHIGIMIRTDRPPSVCNLSNAPTTLIDIIYKHVKEELKDYKPKIK